MSEQLTAEEIRKIRQMLENLQRAMIIDPVMIRIVQSEAIGARVIRTTTQNLPSRTFTALSWDTAIHDTDDCWDSGDPTRLYARKEGYYIAGGGYYVNGAPAARFIIRIYRNGTFAVASQDIHTIASKAFSVSCTTGMIWMDEGDFIIASAYQDTGADQTISAATLITNVYNFGWLARLA